MRRQEGSVRLLKDGVEIDVAETSFDHVFQILRLQGQDLHTRHVLREILGIVIRDEFSSSEIGDHVDIEIRGSKNAIRMRIASIIWPLPSIPASSPSLTHDCQPIPFMQTQ